MSLHATPVPAAAADLSTLRGLLAPAILTMAADGHVSTTERRELIGALRFNMALRAHDAATVSDLTEEMLAEAKESPKALEAAVHALPQPLRETAIAMALRIACADGSLADAEHELLVKLAMALDIPDTTYNTIVDVVVMLQRGV